MTSNHTEDQLTKAYGEKRPQRKDKQSGQKKFGEKTDDFYKTIGKAQKWGKKYKTPDEIPDELVPEKYDYRNINNYDFTGPLRNQR